MSHDRNSRRPEQLLALAALVLIGGTGVSAERRPETPMRRTPVSPTELVELRTEFETVFMDANGRLRTEASLSPLHFLDETGRWVPFAPALVEQPDGSLLDEANSLTSHFPARGDGETILWNKTDGAYLQVRPAGLSIQRADGSRDQLTEPWAWAGLQSSEDGSVTYRELYPGVSERYRVEAGRVRHELILSDVLPGVNLGEGDALLISWTVSSAGLHDEARSILRRARQASQNPGLSRQAGVRLPTAGRVTLRLSAAGLPQAADLPEARFPTPIDELAGFLSFGSGARTSTTPGSGCDGSGLFASDAALGNQMGFSVSLQGDTALVGSPRDSERAPSAGAVHVFTRDGADWTETAKLTASDPASGDSFGLSVSISGNTLLIGAPGKDDRGASSGAAYVFELNHGEWEEVQILTAADGDIGDVFGRSVSLSGGLALVSADGDDDAGTRSGSAYVFRRDDGDWLQEAKLIGSDTSNGDRFGFDLSLHDETAIIGAPSHQVDGAAVGSAYIFTRASGWTEQAMLVPGTGEEGGLFGISVSISGERAVIGAPLHLSPGLVSGAAHVYARTGAAWLKEATLLPSVAAHGDEFGRAVSLVGSRILVGATGADDTAIDAGVAVLFLHDGSSWTEAARLVDASANPGDGFGVAVAVSEDSTLVGVSGNDAGGRNAGSASVRTCALD